MYFSNCISHGLIYLQKRSEIQMALFYKWQLPKVTSQIIGIQILVLHFTSLRSFLKKTKFYLDYKMTGLRVPNHHLVFGINVGYACELSGYCISPILSIKYRAVGDALCLVKPLWFKAKFYCVTSFIMTSYLSKNLPLELFSLSPFTTFWSFPIRHYYGNLQTKIYVQFF